MAGVDRGDREMAAVRERSGWIHRFRYNRIRLEGRSVVICDSERLTRRAR
jgi:hypothetical protein